MTSAGFLPPISMIRGRGIGRVALSRISFMPTSFDPVKTMPSMSGLSMSSWPAVLPPPVTKLNTPGGMPASAIISYELVAEERRDRRRLEHDGVAGDQRAAGRSGRERERKVERRDDRPDAVRPQHADVLFAGPERADSAREAVVLLDLVAVVRDQIGRLLDVADALEPVLARLVSHERRELPAVGANRCRRRVVSSATRSRHGLALHAGNAARRRRDRVCDVFARAALERAEQDARVDGASVVELARPPARRVRQSCSG